jgi:hypothetical protein
MTGGASAHAPLVGRPEPTPLPSRGQCGRTPRLAHALSASQARSSRAGTASPRARGRLARGGWGGARGGRARPGCRRGTRPRSRGRTSRAIGGRRARTSRGQGRRRGGRARALRRGRLGEVGGRGECFGEVVVVESSSEAGVGEALGGHERMFAYGERSGGPFLPRGGPPNPPAVARPRKGVHTASAQDLTPTRLCSGETSRPTRAKHALLPREIPLPDSKRKSLLSARKRYRLKRRALGRMSACRLRTGTPHSVDERVSWRLSEAGRNRSGSGRTARCARAGSRVGSAAACPRLENRG